MINTGVTAAEYKVAQPLIDDRHVDNVHTVAERITALLFNTVGLQNKFFFSELHFAQELPFVHQRVRRMYPLYNGRQWTVMPDILNELQSLYTHIDLPRDDCSSSAAYRFWVANGDKMPLLAIIAQIGLVTPIVTTVVENCFGILGASLSFFINVVTIFRRHAGQCTHGEHLVTDFIDAPRGEHVHAIAQQHASTHQTDTGQ